MGGALGFCIGEEHVKMMALNGGKLQKKTNEQTKRKEKLSKKTRKGNLKNSISIVQIVKSKSQVLRSLIYTRLKINKKINLCTSFQSRSMFHFENIAI